MRQARARVASNGEASSQDEYPKDQRGDAWEEPGQHDGREDARPGDSAGPPTRAAFPDPIPAPQLRDEDPERDWLWRGWISRGGITLLSALWKTGKTTLLAHLLKALEAGGDFCGHSVVPGRVLYVTEESQKRWAKRRDRLGLKDHIEFQVRPFAARPRREDWRRFLDYLCDIQGRRAFDLLVFDTLSNLWPVRDENDAAQVQEALMPLQPLAGQDAGLLLVHHMRKGDGGEATAARGSGALPAFVDTVLEFRRFKPKDRKDCRRVLTGYGRDEETPAEVVVELTEDGYQSAGGDCRAVAGKSLTQVILGLLPRVAPGLTSEEILKAWPDESGLRKQTLLDALKQGAERGDWRREGKGKSGSPHTYWFDPFSLTATDGQTEESF
jgi:hypothetical protein